MAIIDRTIEADDIRETPEGRLYLVQNDALAGLDDRVRVGFLPDAPFGAATFPYGAPPQQGEWSLQQDPWGYGQSNPWLQPWGQQPWWQNPKSPWGATFAQGSSVAGLPGFHRVGRLSAEIIVHGGDEAVLGILDGLVQRNERALRQPGAPTLGALMRSGKLRYAEGPVWKDVPAAAYDRTATSGTIAAWRAAEKRIGGESAGLVMVRGVPMIATRNSVGGLDLEDPAAEFGRPRHVVPEAIRGVAPREGIARANIMLTLDDPYGLPIAEVGSAIARHNARQIKRNNLPRLYSPQSKVRYANEETERWLDAQQIVDEGCDDCEGLAAYRAGELIADEGLTAGVATRVIPSPAAPGMGGGGGGRLFHAVTGVRMPDGRTEFDDPSARLGMKVPPFYRKYAAQQRSRGLPL